MKRIMYSMAAVMCAVSLITGCGQQKDGYGKEEVVQSETAQTVRKYEDATKILLSDEGIMVDDEAISEDETADVYAARDIVFYLAGQDFTYGAGSEADAHTQEEADAHTVVHISKPGTYVLSGTLSKGQIAIDLGEEAKDDPEAVVTLVLNGVNVNCDVAPAVIFYKVYECGSDDVETADWKVDTSEAGARVIIADDTENNITGSYVARIYKSYELNESGTEVVSNKKLHKYDGAFYSKMSMNIDGEEKGNGVLRVTAENEGIDSELHLSINGGNIFIASGNDGINTNEDEVSVTTINGGTLTVCVTGETGEGDGIDSNGWIVINGGTVISAACSDSMDAGIDSDMGIYIYGGTVFATGNMYDHIDEESQNFAVVAFTARQKGGSTYELKDAEGAVLAELTPENDFSYLIFSSEALTEGTYTLWQGDIQIAAAKDENTGFGGMGFGEGKPQPPEGMELAEGEGKPQPPEGMELAEGEGKLQPPEGMELAEGEGKFQRPGGMRNFENAEAETELVIGDGANFFWVLEATGTASAGQ